MPEVGIAMDYLFYGFAGVVAAGVVAGILVFLARAYLPPSLPGRRTFLWRCARAPFLGLVWILITWIVYSYLLGSIFHRDNGLSTNWHAPMPNGYVVGNRSYAFGYLVGPGIKSGSDYPPDGPGSVAAILYLQETEPYLLGKRFVSDSIPAARGAYDYKYFLVDTRTHQILRWDSIDDLRAAASIRGVTVAFEENWGGWCWAVYAKYRPTWFDWFFPVVSLLGIAGGAGLLFAQCRRLKRAAHEAV